MSEVQVTPPVEKKMMRRAQLINHPVVLLVIFPLLVWAYRNSRETLAWLSGQRPEEIADLGVEALQGLYIASFTITFAVVFCYFLSIFIENQFRPDAFNRCSRRAIIWSLLVLCFSIVAAATM